MSTVSASPRAGNSATVKIPHPTAWVRLVEQGWTGDLGEHAEFGMEVAWAGQGLVSSSWHNDRVTAAEAEAFAAELIVACNIAGLPDQAARDSAAIVLVPLPTADAFDSEIHEPGYTYFGRVGARAGQQLLLVDGEFVPVDVAWSAALNLIAAGRVARKGRAA
ncbi:hypothetical protein [Nocardia wallacei]|uniref:hypothetical protein n=1 Tax=Nocardia wallacei TaxID=480035 RepID=UPI002458DE0C|nr:hypothetical protein [Nocardia wallacei]